jgi:hypothetical protein
MQQTIDITGLSTESVRAVEALVNMLRAKEIEASPNLRDPEAWSAALHRWAEGHPKREIVIDDSRETIYSGRGE